MSEQFEVRIHKYEGWISATVDDPDGNRLGEESAPVLEGATFDARAAVVRAAVEEALTQQSEGSVAGA